MPDMAPTETIYLAQAAPRLAKASENAAMGFTCIKYVTVNLSNLEDHYALIQYPRVVTAANELQKSSLDLGVGMNLSPPLL